MPHGTRHHHSGSPLVASPLSSPAQRPRCLLARLSGQQRGLGTAHEIEATCSERRCGRRKSENVRPTTRDLLTGWCSQEAGDGKAKGLRNDADPWALVCKWVTGASVFGLLVLLTILVTEVQEEVEVEGVTHAKEVMRTQFINKHESHVVDPGVRSRYQPVKRQP